MATIFGYITTETPKYTVVQKKVLYEIRQYARQLRAEVEVDQKAPMQDLGHPFRMLAGYIFGGNTKRSAQEAEKVAMTAPVVMQQQQQQGSSDKVAMTAPVVMEASGKQKMKMSFIMPSKYKSVDELPVPKDARVHLVEVPEYKVAVIKFSGTFSDANFRAKEAQLRQAAAADGVKLSEAPDQVQRAGYNPPWTLPWCRTNEVMIPVLD